MTQEEIFIQVYDKYKHVLPNLKHGSGGLPDTKGLGTSDVDICLLYKEHASLSKYFPEDTEIDTNEGRTVYTLKGYEREVNIYCSDGEWWDKGARDRKTELTLNTRYPDLSIIAFNLKKYMGISTEEVWARILGLGENYSILFHNTDKVMDVAEKISKKFDLIKDNLPNSKDLK